MVVTWGPRKVTWGPRNWQIKSGMLLKPIHVRTNAELIEALRRRDRPMILERTWSLMVANLLFGFYIWADKGYKKHLEKYK